MLLILYGAIAEMGFNSRQYLVQSGFREIIKYNYSEAPRIATQYGTRNYVSKEEFLKNTDSLFRYEVGGIHVGFNEQQILDAVSGKTNSLLSLSTGDIAFLAEIKRVYADQVRLIYAYIDDTTLKTIISGLKNMTEEKAKTRFEIGQDVKQGYLQYRQIFDYVVIYGGEDSAFDYRNLYRQFDSILREILQKEEPRIQYADVFISYAHKDADLYNVFRRALSSRGMSVFDDAQLPAGTDWQGALSAAIQNAKIVIPIITDNALNTSAVIDETNLIISSAENNGALIIPVFSDGVDLDKAPDLKQRLEFLSCVILAQDQIAEASVSLADKVHRLLTAEADLTALSKRVENYLCLKMYDQAKCWQDAHLALCDEIFAQTRGIFVNLESCLLSRIKLISILQDMKSYEEALEQTVEALNLLDDGDEYDVLVDQFALCCAYLNMNVASVRELALKRLQPYMHNRLDDFVTSFVAAQKTVKANRQNTDSKEERQSEDEKKIAQYGEMAIALFEELIQDNSKSLSRHDLMLGYERILNYCKHVGLKGEVAEKCISRIAALGSITEMTEEGENTITTQALKLYLGQAVRGSGEYDVFLSFKSEDEALARKVYDYLTQSGKEVFFSKETLQQLGNSEYEDEIYHALDHSRHMVVVSSNPDYLKTKWVQDEWGTFNNEIREGRKSGNLVLLLTDDIAADKGRLPVQLRQKEIVKMSEFRSRLLSYLR